mgnify:CR=1 FL=1
MKQNTTYKQTELGLIPEDWEVKKLGELGFFFKGKGVPKTSIVTEGKYKCLTYGDLYTKYDYVIKNVKSFINDASDSQEINFGDICIAGSGETIEDIGKCAVFIDDKTGYAGGDIIIFRSDENPLTLSYILNSDLCKRQKYRLGQGHSVVHIYSSQLQNLKIPLPPLPEQKKIADCLSTWDSAIEKQSALINALTDRKKALMQQLLTGKKRLPGFEGEWKEVSLIELADFRRGSFPQPYGLPEWYDNENGEPFIQVYDVGDNFNLKPTTKSKISELAQVQSVFIKKGTLIVTLQGSIGKVAITNYDAYIDRTLLLFSSFKMKVDIYFIMYQIHNLFNIEKEKAPGGIIKTITKEVLSNFKIKLPSFEEQTAIAEILATADRELQLQKEKLAQLQTQKKGLMQVLLTGKKRLIN